MPIGKYFLIDFVSVDKLSHFLDKIFGKIEKDQNSWENKNNDVSIFQTLLSHRIKKERFDARQNNHNIVDDLDPY